MSCYLHSVVIVARSVPWTLPHKIYLNLSFGQVLESLS